MIRFPKQVTDGHENSSREWTHESITDLIERHKEHGWTFIFLAANQDAIQTGAAFGFAAGSCATFDTSSAGVGGAFRSAASLLCRAVCEREISFTAAERAACFGHDRAPGLGALSRPQGGRSLSTSLSRPQGGLSLWNPCSVPNSPRQFDSLSDFRGFNSFAIMTSRASQALNSAMSLCLSRCLAKERRRLQQAARYLEEAEGAGAVACNQKQEIGQCYWPLQAEDVQL